MTFYEAAIEVLKESGRPLHYKKITDITHQAGKLLVFHSCGNMYRLMDDVIDAVGVDAKHSFEDKIVPVEEAYRRWGDRVAILGGVDMDLLGRGTEEQVRARTREILEVYGGEGPHEALAVVYNNLGRVYQEIGDFGVLILDLAEAALLSVSSYR